MGAKVECHSGNFSHRFYQNIMYLSFSRLIPVSTGCSDIVYLVTRVPVSYSFVRCVHFVLIRVFATLYFQQNRNEIVPEMQYYIIMKNSSKRMKRDKIFKNDLQFPSNYEIIVEGHSQLLTDYVR